MKLSLKNCSFSYREGEPIIKDLSIDIEPGRLVAILGPNGSGKTTLLRCIMNFLKWDGGNCTLDDEEISSMPPSRLWSRIAYVPQAKGVCSGYTAYETALLGRAGRGGVFSNPSKKDKDAAMSALRRLGVAHLADRRCSEMSGGELQMVLIARALAAEPKIMILDEPESNLDFKNQLIILDTLSELAASGMACVFNTHYPAHALSRADKSLLLAPGGEYLFGDSAKIITEPNIRRFFGVDAVIGSVEGAGTSAKTVIPLNLASGDAPEEKPGGRVLAVISMIIREHPAVEKINAILESYSGILVGRMGMPYRRAGVSILNVTADADKKEIDALTTSLGAVRGVSVKTITTAADESADIGKAEVV